jgi:hypothetical protein
MTKLPDLTVVYIHFRLGRQYVIHMLGSGQCTKGDNIINQYQFPSSKDV